MILSITQFALVKAILIFCYGFKVFELVFDRFVTYLNCPALRRQTVSLALSLVTEFKKIIWNVCALQYDCYADIYKRGNLRITIH